jgi:hypothetical protein
MSNRSLPTVVCGAERTTAAVVVSSTRVYARVRTHTDIVCTQLDGEGDGGDEERIRLNGKRGGGDDDDVQHAEAQENVHACV